MSLDGKASEMLYSPNDALRAAGGSCGVRFPAIAIAALADSMLNNPGSPSMSGARFHSSRARRAMPDFNFHWFAWKCAQQPVRASLFAVS